MNTAIRYWDYGIEKVLLNGLDFDEVEEMGAFGVRVGYVSREGGWEVQKEDTIFHGTFGGLGD